MAEDRLANCRSDKGSSRRLTMISCKPFQNASSTLTLERSTTDDFMARLPRRSGGNFGVHWRLNFDVGTLVPFRGEKTQKFGPQTPPGARWCEGGPPFSGVS